MRPSSTLPIQGEKPRILIIRLSALGDVVFTTSLLDGLRARYPQAHIGWLVQDNFAGILDGDPRLNELITVQRKALGSISALKQLRRRLAASQFEWVIDAQGLLKARILASLVPNARRVGFPSKEPGEFLMDRIIPQGDDTGEISWEYRHLAEQITGQLAGPPTLSVRPEQAATVQAEMQKLGLKPGFTAFCPFTTRPQKHWIEPYWPQLARLLAGQSLGPVVMFGGPADVAAAERIAAELPPGSINLVGKTRLQSLPAWFEQSRLLIGVDTGLTHIGIALRRPVIALFGSTLPYVKNTGLPLQVMYDALPCAPCRRAPTCNGEFTCMRLLTPGRVVKTAEQLLAEAGRTS